MTLMPLFEMSTNVQERKPARKRSHDEFSGDECAGKLHLNDKDSKSNVGPSSDTYFTPATETPLQSSPKGRPDITEAESTTTACTLVSPETPVEAAAASLAAAAQTSNPAAKRKRLTKTEKETREKEAFEKKELKKQEREEKAALRAAEKAKQEEEKAARQQEKEERRKKKEQEEKVKAEQREEKKRQKEEEERRLQEEKEKKCRAQPSLMRYFGGAPKKTTLTACADSPAVTKKSEISSDGAEETEYQKLFRPFFVHETTRWVQNRLGFDEKARALKSQMLDECIAEQHTGKVPFDPVSLFALPGSGRCRGKLHHPVRHIMEGVYKEMERAGSSGMAACDELQSARKKLVGVPMKIIAFSQDVRPPYYGTVTHRQYVFGKGNMNKVARQSTSRRLQLDYDYDSEAEWQEEEGEDLDADDGDEELDDEDDMDGFLDDSEDAGLSRRIFGNVMEPECTGICFENANGKTTKSSATDCKMEMMLDVFSKTASIDPFSTSYWEPETTPATTKGTSASTGKAEKMLPPPTPSSGALGALSGSLVAEGVSCAKLVKAELMDDVKRAILQNRALSKVGMMDFIFQQFRDSVSRIEVKNTLELVAEKKKTGKIKEWDLKPGHEISPKGEEQSLRT